MEEFFTKVPNYSIEKCEKPFPLLIDFDLKESIMKISDPTRCFAAFGAAALYH
jgi:hypothetical protein